ncbi:MAG TPA: dephospho-CoA kinase [Bacteroidales bacterium]|nr:dephospho-CoA kinase [Bacteroidales bacterium]
MNKFIIGITGNIGSGKSTFAKWFNDLDCCIIDLDYTAKTLCKKIRCIRQQTY